MLVVLAVAAALVALGAVLVALRTQRRMRALEEWVLEALNLLDAEGAAAAEAERIMRKALSRRDADMPRAGRLRLIGGSAQRRRAV